MNTTFKTGIRRLLVGWLLAALVAAGAGCQTFTLSEEEFQRQQGGHEADRSTGEAVAVVGTLGWLGVMIGLATADAAKK
ncbi:MAG TPA: hypothetical protein VK327_09605 [Candidatus Paceibacterota bacterium]|nr:hypothetical protein [Candidatus Paceibacterota bacterium]